MLYAPCYMVSVSAKTPLSLLGYAVTLELRPCRLTIGHVVIHQPELAIVTSEGSMAIYNLLM